MQKPLITALLATMLAIPALPAMAQERALAFSLTGGARVAPSYFGASGSEVRPMARFSFAGLRIGGLELGSVDGPVQFAPGAGLRGAVRYIPVRRGRNELAGLADVRAALELGPGLHYTEENWQVYADLRYGVIGHRGFAGEIGANAIWRTESGLVLHGGPRAEFGDRRFAQTYFGVPAGAPLPAFNASGGFHSVGLEFGAYQPLSPDWGVTGSLRFDRLRGNAAASPIVRQGNRNQITAEIGLTRHFNLRF